MKFIHFIEDNGELVATLLGAVTIGFVLGIMTLAGVQL